MILSRTPFLYDGHTREVMRRKAEGEIVPILLFNIFSIERMQTAI